VPRGLYRPDIATLDCGSLNFGDGNRAYVSTPNYLRQGAAICGPGRQAGTGGLRHRQPLVRQADDQGRPARRAVADPAVHGHPYGVPADTGHLLAMVNSLPRTATGDSFAISRMQMPWVAQSILLGGNVRVGLEDNLYLSRGVYASNAQLVEKARTIIEAMGARVLTRRGARAPEAALIGGVASDERMAH
jgi:uncharacterized protein (DUF849 family)